MAERPPHDRLRATEESPPDVDLVEYIVIVVPDLSLSAAIVEALTSLVSRSSIRILDLVGVSTDTLGRYVAAEVEAIPALAVLQNVDGEVGGFLSEDDIAIACRALQPGVSALILLVEDQWAQELADAARSQGGQIVGGERLPRHRLEQATQSRG